MEQDVFLHVSAVERAATATPTKANRLSYDVESGRDGRESAVNLRQAED
jgi:CspA family cold shock protein